MKYNVRGDKILVTDAIKDYITEKIDKLNKIINDQDSTTGRNRVEITLSKVLNLQNEKTLIFLTRNPYLFSIDLMEIQH